MNPKHNGELTKKLDDLYGEHVKKYDDFEHKVRHLNGYGLISDQQVADLLNLADEAVESGMGYSAELGKMYTWRWFMPSWWTWRFSDAGRRMFAKPAYKE